MYGMPNRREAVDRALEDLGLQTRANQLTGALSGGWKQRLALAACLLHEPRLLLLDEPTAGVDPTARRDFWEQLHELAARGISVLVSTHYMDEAERCHKLAYISYGKLLIQGTADEVIARQRLTTWAIHGHDLVPLAQRLRGAPGWTRPWPSALRCTSAAATPPCSNAPCETSWPARTCAWNASTPAWRTSSSI